VLDIQFVRSYVTTQDIVCICGVVRVHRKILSMFIFCCFISFYYLYLTSSSSLLYVPVVLLLKLSNIPSTNIILTSIGLSRFLTQIAQPPLGIGPFQLGTGFRCSILRKKGLINFFVLILADTYLCGRKWAAGTNVLYRRISV